MKFPELNEMKVKQEMISTFRGYNHNLRIGSGEFFDMKNLTSSSYPVLSPREKRGTYNETTVTDPQGMIAKDSLCYVDGSHFVCNGYRVDIGLSTDEENCHKTLISMGAYVIILPDKKWVNTANWDSETPTDGYGDIDATVTTEDPVTFTLTKVDGAEYDEQYNVEPAEPQNGDLWVDRSSTPHTLKQYSSASSMWVTIATTYIKIHSPGIGLAFEQFDGVKISGLKDETLTLQDGNELTGDTAEQIKSLDGSFVIWAKGDDYIVVIGILDSEQTITNSITVSRKMPAMDFITESENRLWGCRYGISNSGDVVNEIYASKLGDFKNWNCFMGISTDSYVASCGTDGVFTGAITHRGSPLFFKENCVHKIYGSYPSNYQVTTTVCRGVQKGSEKSLSIVNEVLYYKSRNGVCAYDGSLPSDVSYEFGGVPYHDAVASAHWNKYFISMADESNNWHLFVYDTEKGIWHKEDDLNVMDFCSARNELYYIESGKKEIRTMFGSGEKDNSPVDWMAESGIIGTDEPGKKYISNLIVRMSLGVGSKVYFYAQYDSSGEWEYLSMMKGTTLRSFSVPIRPKRCDHMRLRIMGIGEANIFSIAKSIESGSDM